MQEVIGEEQPTGDRWVFVGRQDADLTDYNATKALFDRVKPTMVVHLAAYVGGLFGNMVRLSPLMTERTELARQSLTAFTVIYFCRQDLQVEFWRKNTKMQNNIMVLCWETGVKKLSPACPTCIFPDKTSYPIDESMIHLGPPFSSHEVQIYCPYQQSLHVFSWHACSRDCVVLHIVQ